MKRNVIISILWVFLYSTLIAPSAYSFDITQKGPPIQFPKYMTVEERTRLLEEARRLDREDSYSIEATIEEVIQPEEDNWAKDRKSTPPRKKGPDKGPDEVYILKKADVERIGKRASYEEFAGLRFAKYFTVGQRIEIIQDAKPIDSYILDAKHIRILGQNGVVREWNTPAHFRSQIVPQFSRAYGTQITIDNPDDPSGHVAQIRNTIDYREIYKEYYPKWPHLLWSRWLQNELMLIHGTMISPADWYYTVNLGYRYSTIVEKDTQPTPTNAGYENRHTYIVNLALAPSDRFEWFGQFEYFKSKRPRSTFPFSPDHWFWRSEFRIKTADRKTSIIPAASYSVDYYFPLKNRFEKYELSLRLGRDFSERLKGSTQLQYVLSLRDEPDNTAPTYAAPNAFKDSAAWVGIDNKMSYNIWKDFYLQGGVDAATGLNMSDFDNVGTLLGIEYYRPGVLRANAGWNTNYYYNIDDFLNTFMFKFFFFM